MRSPPPDVIAGITSDGGGSTSTRDHWRVAASGKGRYLPALEPAIIALGDVMV
jgi:hypothetical protein